MQDGQNTDRSRLFYDTLVSSGAFSGLPEYDRFMDSMSSESKRKQFYDVISTSEKLKGLPDYERFSTLFSQTPSAPTDTTTATTPTTPSTPVASNPLEPILDTVIDKAVESAGVPTQNQEFANRRQRHASRVDRNTGQETGTTGSHRGRITNLIDFSVQDLTSDKPAEIKQRTKELLENLFIPQPVEELNALYESFVQENEGAKGIVQRINEIEAMLPRAENEAQYNELVSEYNKYYDQLKEIEDRAAPLLSRYNELHAAITQAHEDGKSVVYARRDLREYVTSATKIATEQAEISKELAELNLAMAKERVAVGRVSAYGTNVVMNPEQRARRDELQARQRELALQLSELEAKQVGREDMDEVANHIRTIVGALRATGDPNARQFYTEQLHQLKAAYERAGIDLDSFTSREQNARMASQALSSLVGGLTEIPASLVEFVGLAAKATDAYVYDKTKDEYFGVNLANAMRNAAKYAFPGAEEYQEDFLVSAIPGALGSFGGYGLFGRMAQRQFGKLVTRGTITQGRAQDLAMTSTALLAGGSGYVEAYNRADGFKEMLVRSAREQGISYEEYLEKNGITDIDPATYAKWGFFPGVVQVYPIMKTLQRFDGFSKGTLSATLGQYARSALTGGAEEFLLESTGAIGQNVLESMYNQDKDFFEGVGLAGASGGVGGGLFNLIGAMVVGAKFRAGASIAPGQALNTIGGIEIAKSALIQNPSSDLAQQRLSEFTSDLNGILEQYRPRMEQRKNEIEARLEKIEKKRGTEGLETQEYKDLSSELSTIEAVLSYDVNAPGKLLEVGTYSVNGQPVSANDLFKLLSDDKFVKDVRDGKIDVAVENDNAVIARLGVLFGGESIPGVTARPQNPTIPQGNKNLPIGDPGRPAITQDQATAYARFRLQELEETRNGKPGVVVQDKDGKPVRRGDSMPKPLTNEQELERRFLEQTSGDASRIANYYGLRIEQGDTNEIRSQQDSQQEGIQETRQAEPGSESVNATEQVTDAIVSNKQYTYDGPDGKVTGELRIDGQLLVLENKDTIIEIGNASELSGKSIADTGLAPAETSGITLSQDGRTIDIDGVKYSPSTENAIDSVVRNQSGGYSVNLINEKGQRRTVRGQRAEEIAYQLFLKEFEQNATDQQIESAITEAQQEVSRQGESTKEPARQDASTETQPTVAKTPEPLGQKDLDLFGQIQEKISQGAELTSLERDSKEMFEQAGYAFDETVTPKTETTETTETTPDTTPETAETTTTQPPPVEAPIGSPERKINIDFKADGSQRVEGYFDLVEASDLTPSHNIDGSRNPNHRISEGQPRDRSSDDLRTQPVRMAENLNPSRITGNELAFYGAPVTTADNQVIQGNGRSMGLKTTYAEFPAKAAEYKSYLRDNAETFGLTAGQVDAMQNPVLVRKVNVSDAEAIKLGNLQNTAEAKMSQIDAAKGYIRNLDESARRAIGSLIAGSEAETLGAIIDDVGFEIISQIKDLDRSGLVDKNGLTASGKEFLRNVFTGLVFDSSINKDAIKQYTRLPHTIKAGIEKSFGRLIQFVGTDADITTTVQKAVEIVDSIMNSSGAIKDVASFMRQGDAFTGQNSDRFTPAESALADKMLNAKKQREIEDLFRKYEERIYGKQDFFDPIEPAGATKQGREIAQAEAFGVATQPDSKPKSPVQSTDRASESTGIKPQADQAKPATQKKSEVAKTKVDKAKDELLSLLEDFNKKFGSNINMGIDPQAIVLAGKIIAKFGELRIRRFQEFGYFIIENMGDGAWKSMFPSFRAAYVANIVNDNVFGESLDRIATIQAQDVINEYKANQEVRPDQGDSAGSQQEPGATTRSDTGSAVTTEVTPAKKQEQVRPPLVYATESRKTPASHIRVGTYPLLDDHQVLAVNLAIDRANQGGKAFLLADGTGVGKELDVNTPILTSNGWIRIGDVNIGDRVYGLDGKLHNVTGVFPQGVKPLYTMKFSDGSNVLAGLEHQWAVRSENDRSRGNDYRVLTTSKLIDTLHYEWSIPLVEPIQYEQSDVLIHPYILGVLIGDGSLTSSGVRFVPGREDVAKKVESYLPEKYSITSMPKYGKSTPYSIVYEDTNKNPFSRELVGLGLRTRAEYKFIPKKYLYASESQRWELLSGLIDTDGWVSENRIRYYTTSRVLHENVLELCRSLGLWASASFGIPKKKNELPVYTISIANYPTEKLGVKNSFTNLGPRKHRVLKSVEYSHHSEAVCISVDAEDSLYIVKDHIVTHNTMEILAIADQLGKGGKVLIVTQNKTILKNFEADAAKIGVDLSKFELGTYADLRTKKIGKGKYEAVIYDEAHNLKNATSIQAIAAESVYTKYSVYATATPMDTASSAVYFIGKMTDKSEADIYDMLGFAVSVGINEYTGEQYREITIKEGVSPSQIQQNIIAIRNQMIDDGSMIRREYPFFGKINELEFPVTAEYRAQEQQITDYWYDLADGAPPMKRMNLMGQMSGELSRFNEQTKFPEVVRLVDKAIAEGRSIVVVAEGVNDTEIKALDNKVFKGLLSMLSEHLDKKGIAHAKIYGGGKKDGEVQMFQSGQVQVALATPQSGGTGINLDDTIGNRPRTLVMATPNYSGNQIDQIFGRVSRRNTASPAEAIMLFNNSESDGRRREIVRKKLNVLRAIQRGKLLEETEFTGAETPAINNVVKEAAENLATEINAGSRIDKDVAFEKISERAFIVKMDRGSMSQETFENLKETLKSAGAKWYGKGAGWMFPATMIGDVRTIVTEAMKHNGKIPKFNAARLPIINQRLRESLYSMNMGIDPAQLGLIGEKVVIYMKAGITKFSDIAKQLIRNYGPQVIWKLNDLYYDGAKKAGIETSRLDDAQSVMTQIEALNKQYAKHDTMEGALIFLDEFDLSRPDSRQAIIDNVASAARIAMDSGEATSFIRFKEFMRSRLKRRIKEQELLEGWTNSLSEIETKKAGSMMESLAAIPGIDAVRAKAIVDFKLHAQRRIQDQFAFVQDTQRKIMRRRGYDYFRGEGERRNAYLAWELQKGWTSQIAHERTSLDNPLSDLMGIYKAMAEEGFTPMDYNKYTRLINNAQTFEESGDTGKAKQARDEARQLLESDEVQKYLVAMHAKDRNSAMVNEISQEIDRIQSDINDLNTEMQSDASARTKQNKSQIKEWQRQIKALVAKMPRAERAMGMSTPEAEAYIASLPADKIAKLERIAQKVYDFNNALLDFKVSEGLISADMADALRDKFGDRFVPAERILFDEAGNITDPDLVQLDSGGKMASRRGVQGTGFKRAFGSDREITPVILTIASRWENTIAAASRNQVLSAFAEMVDAEWKAGNESLGRSYHAAEQVPSEKMNMVVKYRGDDGQGGISDRVLVFFDKNLYEAATGANTLESGPFVNKIIRPIMNYLRFVRTTGSIGFMIANAQRDFWFAAANIAGDDNLKGARKFMTRMMRNNSRFGDAHRGIWEYMQGMDTPMANQYKYLKELGGTTGFYSFRDPADIMIDLKKSQDNINRLAMKPGNRVNPVTYFKQAIQFVEKMNEVVENASRLTAFNIALEDGMSPREAASYSLNLNTNFNKQGDWGLLTRTAYQFMNSAIQGHTAMFRRAKNNPKIFGSIAMSLAGLGAAAGLWNDFVDEDEHDRLRRTQPWLFDTRLVVMMPGGIHFSLYLPFGYSTFKAMGDNIYAYATGAQTGEKTTSRIAEATANSFNPFRGSQMFTSGATGLGLALSPTIVQPVAELMSNQGYFGPIYPELTLATQDQRGIPDVQVKFNGVNPIADHIAKWLYKNKIADISPQTFEYLFYAYTGSVGREWVGTLTEGATSIGLVERDPKFRGGIKIGTNADGTDQRLDLNQIAVINRFVRVVDQDRTAASNMYKLMIENSPRTGLDVRSEDFRNNVLSRIAKDFEIIRSNDFLEDEDLKRFQDSINTYIRRMYARNLREEAYKEVIDKGLTGPENEQQRMRLYDGINRRQRFERIPRMENFIISETGFLPLRPVTTARNPSLLNNDAIQNIEIRVN